MRIITVDIQGGDGAHRARLREYSTRPIRFPDGITRLITARTVLWEALTEIQGALAFTEEEFAERVHEHARQDSTRYGTSFEAEVQWCWTRKAREFWRCYCASKETEIANG